MTKIVNNGYEIPHVQEKKKKKKLKAPFHYN